MRDANEWPEQVKKIEDATRRLTETDYWFADRERDYALANCNHNDSGIEKMNDGSEYLVCYSCGRTSEPRKPQ